MIDTQIIANLKNIPVDKMVEVLGLQYRALKLSEYAQESRQAAINATDALVTLAATKAPVVEDGPK